MHSFSRKMRTSTVAAFTLMLSVGVIPAVNPTLSEHSTTPAAHAQIAGNPTDAPNYRPLPNSRRYDSCSTDRNFVYAKTWWDNDKDTRLNGGKDVSVIEVTINSSNNLARDINIQDSRVQLDIGSDQAGWKYLRNNRDFTLSISGNKVFFNLRQKIQRASSRISSFDVNAKIPLRVRGGANCQITLWHEGPTWFDRKAPKIDINMPETPRDQLGWLPASSQNPTLPKRCGGNIALVFDTSDSIKANNNVGVDSSKNAGLSVIDALKGTGSQMAIYNFASTENSLTGMSTNKLSLNKDDDVQKLRSAVEAIDTIKNRNSVQQGGTNYEAGLNQVPVNEFEIVYFITDGLPTTNNEDYGKGLDWGVYTNQKDISDAVLAANRLKETGTRIETVMVGVTPLEEHILKDGYFFLEAIQNNNNWPKLEGLGYPSYDDLVVPGGIIKVKDLPYVRDLVDKAKITIWDEKNYYTTTEYNITNQPDIWRAGILSPKSIGSFISSDDAVTTVDNFNNLVDQLNEVVLRDCFGSINVTKLVHGEDGSVTPGKDWSFDTKVEGGQAAIIDGEGGTERKVQVTDVTGEDGRYGRALDQQNGQGQSISVVEHQQPGHKLRKQGDKNAVCTTREREGNEWKTKDSVVRNFDDAQKPGFGVDVPFRGIVNCTIENDTVSVKIDLSVEKVSFDDKPQPLEGAEFTLNKVDGDNREPVGVIRDGETKIVDLQPGNRYELVETKAPSGYQLLSRPIYFNIAVGESGKPEIVIEGGKDQYPEISIQEDEKDSNHTVMQVADIRKGDLPNTGGRGLGGLALLASVVAAAAVFIGRRALN